MPGTIPFANVTLNPGETDLGPGAVDDDSVQFTITVDRTPAGGLNSLDGTTSVTVMVAQSGDGGATWGNLGGATFMGGTILDRHGNPRTFDTAQSWLIGGTGRELKIIVTVNGASALVVGGSLTTT